MSKLLNTPKDLTTVLRELINFCHFYILVILLFGLKMIFSLENEVNIYHYVINITICVR